MSREPLNATAASLLGFLTSRPMTGWDLVESIEGSVANFWNVTRSQVYRELKTLAGAGFVREGEAGPRDRTPYTITEAGHRALVSWLSESPGEGMMRLPIVVTIFFGRHLPRAVLARHVAAALAGHEARLADYRALHAEPHWNDDDEPFQRRTLELGIAYETMFIAWLKSLPWEDDAKATARKTAKTKVKTAKRAR